MRRIATLLAIMLFCATQASALVLIDAGKRVIGEVADADVIEPEGFIWIARQSGSATYLLRCNRRQCLSDHFVEYSGANCTGEMGIRVFDDEPQTYVLWPAAIAPPGQTLYMGRKADNQPPQRKTMRSFWQPEFGCIKHETVQPEFYSPVLNLGPLTYTPPLRIKTPRG